MGSPVRVAIVEDDKELRNLLLRRVERAENMRVTASFASGDDFLERLKDLEADVVLMDINMPGRNGIGTVREAKQQRPEVQYLMLTIFENPAYIFEALCAGATGYLLKSTTAEELLDAIRDIHKGGSPMNSTIARLVVNSFQKETQQRINDEQLSDREKQVLDGLASGLQYKEIADKAGISTETVRVHVRRVYSKLQVSGRMEAVRKVYPRGI
ncbi:MAG: response regulator transcription factor [Flavobacteriales bacterium]|jgi:DNA-binding NarL/FixJ family response regulator|nr:response regulator transcription factor [Flavobacteriales bacterium]MBK7270890.1 response regulator transcription factor [Flavobacteriales bacterium]MBK7753275.1 response regulator transcription factor [Flavobacteriales bacterium]MBK9074870.1 response regulator transcription factor [Flavobacteriales bacterium]MBK9538886.1 response regulator transcription factor [Flavobacteriales bacterium]